MKKSDYGKKVNTVDNNTVINKWLITIHAVLAIYFMAMRVYFLMGFSLLGIIINIVCMKRVLTKEDCKLYDKIVFYELWIFMGLSACLMGPKYGFHLLVMAFLVPATLCTYEEVEDIHRDNNLFKCLFTKKEKIIVIIYTVLVYLIMSILDIFNLNFYKFEQPSYDVIAHVTFMANTIFTILFVFFYTKLYTYYINKNESMLRQQADYDKLTGLYNRNRTRFILEHNYNAAVEGSIDFGVAIMDIDDFKKINDNYGHNAGDFVLRKFAATVNDIVKKCEGQIVAGRWGGEEFLIIYYGDNKEDFYMLLDYIRMHINEVNFVFEHNIINISVTIGMTLFQKECKLDEIINVADVNLYAGKKSGKNKVVMEGMN